jgi:hypothetical protein
VKLVRPLTLGALVMASVAVALGLLEIGLRVIDGVAGGGLPGVVDSPKALHRQTPAGKRIMPDSTRRRRAAQCDVVDHRTKLF